MPTITVFIPESAAPPTPREYSRFEPDVESRDTEDAIAWAVGQALNEWEGMESAFAACYGRFCQDSSGIAYASYGTVTSSRARGMMIGQAIERCPPWLEQCATNLRPLLDLAGKFAERRNELAHGYIVGFDSGDAHSYFLVPAAYATRYQLSRTKLEQVVKEQLTSPADLLGRIKLAAGEYAYSAAQILYYRDRFRDLWNKAIIIASECWAATVDARRMGHAPLAYALNGMVSDQTED
ncbi:MULTISPECIES: hypothetical protein [Hyphobacterium]|uniref:Apea-like HEPN domain-containing protein n=1 Tax=Hyphobacterium vulgare TaxID=1736751 RepID=A0ABV6ZU53_9PROT